MKIENQTDYDTKTLRRLMTIAHRRLAETRGRLKTWDRLNVVVVYGRHGSGTVSGEAHLTGDRMRLRLPPPLTSKMAKAFEDRGLPSVRTVKAASVLWLMTHELFHSYGYRHRDFPPHIMHSTSPERFAVPGMDTLSPAPMAARPKATTAELRTLRAERVIARIVTWERKLARAERALKKLRKQQRYYEQAAGHD